jgi:hypothetical protein
VLEPYIQLERSGLVTYVAGRTLGYRMTVLARNALVLPNEIFVFQRAPWGAGTANTFTNVASPADIEEYPTLFPAPDGVFFRKASVDLVFRNVSLADDAWAGIQSDVAELIQTMRFFDNLEVQEVVDFGSSSSSSSA